MMNKHIEEVVSQMTPEQVNKVGIRLLTEMLQKAEMDLSMWKSMTETTEKDIATSPCTAWVCGLSLDNH